MKVLGMDGTPDHSTIDRFIRGNHEAIEDIMRQSVMKLEELGELDGHTIFQDGTKIESAAGKYTFVWRTACEKNLAKAGNIHSYGALPVRRTLPRLSQGSPRL